MNNLGLNASRHLRNKKKEYLKDEIEELEINSNVNIVRDLYKGINDFKKGYQHRNINVKNEKGEFVADPRQAAIHTVDPLVHEPSAFEIELVIGKLKNHISPGIDQIPAEFIKAGVGQFAVRFINYYFYLD